MILYEASLCLLFLVISILSNREKNLFLFRLEGDIAVANVSFVLYKPEKFTCEATNAAVNEPVRKSIEVRQSCVLFQFIVIILFECNISKKCLLF